MVDAGETPGHVKGLFDGLSPYFDAYLATFGAQVYACVTWQHLRQFIPNDDAAIILDAGGGTGKWALPLARMGRHIVLCDLSVGMLRQAQAKVGREGLTTKVSIVEADITNLPIADEQFDCVICEDGPLSIAGPEGALPELVRVLKKGGGLWAAVIGRYAVALGRVANDAGAALRLAKGETSYGHHAGTRSRVFAPQELAALFEANGVEVLNLYANGIVTRLLSREIVTSTEYDDDLFSRVSQLELLLSEEPSLLGMGQYVQIAGRKR